MRWYFLFFVASGFCSLVYEIVWLRLAMASFGLTTAMASIVLSMFMAGLGLGSWRAGVLSRREITASTALRLYSLAEALIGISALLVPYELKIGRSVLQSMSGSAAWQSSSYYWLAGTWIAVTLLPWCTCMGSTFPLLMKAIRQTVPTGQSFSYLYVANVLGALLGTMSSAFILIEVLGFRGTLSVAATLNFFLALSAFRLSLAVESPNASEVSSAVHAVRSRVYGISENCTLYILFITGLVSMGMEVVWIRQFTPYLGNVVYAFAGILAVYLLATFWGSQDYRSWIRSHAPEESAPAWTLLALFSIFPLTAADPLLPLRIGGVELGGIRLSAIVLFCAYTGFLTPLLADTWSGGDPDRAGKAYAVNILGSILGPLAAGFWLLPKLGERWSLGVLSIPLFIIAAIISFRKSIPGAALIRSLIGPKLRYVIAVVAAVVLVRVSHDYETKYAQREVRRDYTATVIAAGSGFERRLYVNGVGMTILTPTTKYMTHLPMALMARPPQNGLVICFGMGTSFRSMRSWGIPTTAVDLVPSVPTLFGYFHQDAASVLSSPLARVVADDGRRFLDESSQSYDVIVVDPPPPPQAAGSSLLYSTDFYHVVRRHLSRDGILQMWYPAADGDAATVSSVTQALQQSFPFVRAFLSFDGYGIHFLASEEPIAAVSSSVLAERLPPTAATDFLEWGPKTTVKEQFDRVLFRELPVEQLIAEAPRTPVLEDDQPINEYFLLRSWFHYYR